MQKIFLTGFVGREPEEKFTSSHVKVTSFPLAIHVKKGGEPLTLWYRINCWEDTCKHILPLLKKGSCVTVVGDLNPPTTYQNKNGDISIDMRVTAHSISFCSGGNREEKQKEEESIFDVGDLI